MISIFNWIMNGELLLLTILYIANTKVSIKYKAIVQSAVLNLLMSKVMSPTFKI